MSHEVEHGHLFSPDGKPWCRFVAGSVECANGSYCLNPNHREHKDIWGMQYKKLDRWGRPVMPDPVTGDDKSWTRVTTICGTLEDTYGLSERDQRLVAYGVAIREDLRDLAMSADGPDDKKTLGDVAQQAKAAALADRKANMGTALHGFTEKIDRGDRNVRVPESHRERIERYVHAIDDYGIQFIPNLIEAIVCHKDLDYIGTMDRGVYWRRYGLKVSNNPIAFDLKTGNIDYLMLKTAQQLAAYANATHRWVPEREAWEPMPEMNTSFGLVMHLPADSDDPEPKLYRVDLIAGFDLLQESLKVRGIRKSKGRDLFEAVEVSASDVAEAPAENPKPRTRDRLKALKDRVRGLVAAGFKDELLNKWPANTPTFAEGGLTDAHLDAIEKLCDEFERDHGFAA